jgi:C-terminal processing protease CtpA/Prc
MKRAILLLAALALLGATEQPPGWLGMGYIYRSNTKERWLQILKVEANGPAARAGLLPRDLVVQIDGRPLAARDQMEAIQTLRRIRPGQTVRFTVRRGEQTLSLRVTAARMNAAQEKLWREGLEYERGKTKRR